MASINVVDSSGWIEYFAATGRAEIFAPAIEDFANLIVPAITIYEVFKKVLRERGTDEAIQVAAVMQTAQVVDLDAALAMESAKHLLPLADSVIYATAIRFSATVWTQDAHFDGLPQVKYFPK